MSLTSIVLNPVHHTQIRELVMLRLLLAGVTGAVPTLGAGDTKGLIFKITRTSAGVYSLATKVTSPNKMPWIIGNYLAATPAYNTVLCFGAPTYSTTTLLWTFPISTFVGGSAADPATGDFLSLHIDMSNTASTP